jgi:primary-amine oxidase
LAQTIEEGISIRIATPFWEDGNQTIGWMGFINAPTTGSDSATLLPLDLFVRFDLTGRDKASWNVTGWFYNGVFYATTD